MRAQRIPCRHLILRKVARILIHADILVLVSEFVVVVILSEWWSILITVGTSTMQLIIRFDSSTIKMNIRILHPFAASGI